MMTIKKLLLTLSIILSCGLIIGGIVYAQDAPKAKAETKADAKAKAQADADFDFDFDFDFPEPNAFAYAPQDDRNFTFFLSGGTFLGVHVEDVSKENMSRYGMRDVRGVGVTEVVKDSPAEKAGLRKDDVILRFDGESVTSTRKLTRLVSESSPDQNVRLTISRGGSEQEISLTLAERKGMNQIFNSKIGDKLFKIDKNNFPKIKDGDGNFVFSLGMHRRIGVSTQPLSKQLAEYFGVSEGILITSVTENSPAAKAGLKAGDVITAVDGEKIDSPGDVSRIINKKQEGSVSLTVVRDRNTRTVTVTPEKQNTTSGDMRTIVMPRIEIPVVPAINVQLPQIVVPVVPAINVTIPRRAPRAISRTRTVII
jgi:membrane-associated protease RseP (regulator of RpoE activity)